MLKLSRLKQGGRPAHRCSNLPSAASADKQGRHDSGKPIHPKLRNCTCIYTAAFRASENCTARNHKTHFVHRDGELWMHRGWPSDSIHAVQCPGSYAQLTQTATQTLGEKTVRQRWVVRIKCCG